MFKFRTKFKNEVVFHDLYPLKTAVGVKVIATFRTVFKNAAIYSKSSFESS